MIHNICILNYGFKNAVKCKHARSYLKVCGRGFSFISNKLYSTLLRNSMSHGTVGHEVEITTIDLRKNIHCSRINNLFGDDISISAGVKMLFKSDLQKKHYILPIRIYMHYVNTSMQYTAIFHGFKNDNFQMKKVDNFLIFSPNIDRGYTLEPPLTAS